jgi:RNA polymerase sigma factor (sigma-70 family)
MSSLPILPGTSDERLLELVIGGEGRAFEIVVMRYRPSLVGYCMRLGLSDTRAEDAVQQCFLSALLALRRGDVVRDLRAWLGRIAHNVAVNMMRAGRAHRETGVGTDWAAEDLAIHIPDMDGGLAAREALAEVAALPPMQREALLQSALGGRTYGEVAASTGVSEGAVRGLVRRFSGWLGGPNLSAGRVLKLAGLTVVVLAAAGVAVVHQDDSHARSGISATSAAVGTHHHFGKVVAPVSSPGLGGARVVSETPGSVTLKAGPSESEGKPGRRKGEPVAASSTHRPAASHSSPASTESQLPSSTSASGPAQVSAVSPAPSGTITSPPLLPSEKPGESGGAREAEEKAPGTEQDAGTKVKGN